MKTPPKKLSKCKHADRYKATRAPTCTAGEDGGPCDVCKHKWDMKRGSSTLPHGWFEIPGVQTGERSVRERIDPLKPLLKFAKGASVLDLGCAEGCISKWLVDEGRAVYVHGIDKHGPWIDVAKAQMPSPPYNARFNVCDFDNWETHHRALGLLQNFDIVLCLNVAQKLFKPKHFIHDMASRASNIFVYSGPDAILQDARSKNVPVDLLKELGPQFDLLHFDKGQHHRDKGHLGVRMIFKRKRKSKK